MVYSKIIKIPSNVEITNSQNKLHFKGPKGFTLLNIVKELNIHINKNQLEITISSFKDKKNKTFLNLYNTLILNKIVGVSRGFKIPLILKGVGYRASIENNVLILKLGFSHLIKINIPENVKVIINKPNYITFYGIDLDFLTQFIYNIKKYRLPEPYKGKGILYKNEQILRKEGKKNK